MTTQTKGFLTRMAEAIRDWESGGNTNARSYRNNNPGNLKFAGQPAAIDSDPEGHAIFSTYLDGWNALIRQLEIAFNGTSRVYNPRMSLYEFFDRYAEANSSNYAEMVAGRLGVSADTTLQEISEGKNI